MSRAVSTPDLTLKVEHPNQLCSLLDSTHNAGLVCRKPPQGSDEFFAQLILHQLDFNLEVEVQAARELMEKVLDPRVPSSLRNHGLWNVWLDDMASLAESFAKMHKLQTVLVQVETERLCQRFHADTVALRLACVYYGPGTLWLPEDNVRRDVAEQRGTSNDAMVIDPARIEQTCPWDVLVMKGKLVTNLPLYHRSPTVDGQSPPSLMLKLDDTKLNLKRNNLQHAHR
jgi:hypothetical protein